MMRTLDINKNLIAVIVVTALLASDVVGQESRSDSISEIFRSREIIATLVVSSADGETTHVYNESRSNMRFSPASTFKVPNTLIALDAKIVGSQDSLFKWDGTDKGLPQWNSDQTLESALRVSCVWCYQEIAKNVGVAKYESVLAQIDYGNQVIGSDVERFWLNGDLQISATEQINFLRKLYEYELPFQRRHVDILKDIMLIEKNDRYSMYAKSGWATTTPQVGWFIGFVETGEQTWLFAMNMQVDNSEQVSLRKELTLSSLRALGIF